MAGAGKGTGRTPGPTEDLDPSLAEAMFMRMLLLAGFGHLLPTADDWNWLIQEARRYRPRISEDTIKRMIDKKDPTGWGTEVRSAQEPNFRAVLAALGMGEGFKVGDKTVAELHRGHAKPRTKAAELNAEERRLVDAFRTIKKKMGNRDSSFYLGLLEKKAAEAIAWKNIPSMPDDIDEDRPAVSDGEQPALDEALHDKQHLLK